MLFFKSKKSEEAKPSKPVLVFDFGSESVKMLHCNYLEYGLEILGGKKVAYPQGSLSSEGLIRPEAVQPALGEAVRQFFPEGPRKNAISAVVGIGGLGIEGYTSQITYRRAMGKKPIENTEFKTIVKRVLERAEQIMSKKVAWETDLGREMTLLNSEILDITLDGYSVASPVGSAGEKMTFLVYNAYLKADQLKSVAACVHNLDLEIISISSSIYSLLRTVMEAYGQRLSALILDIGGKTSDVGVISSGRILGHINFDAGGSAFTESIAEEFHKDHQEAEQLKLGFAGAKLDEPVMKEIREIIASDCKVYLSGVELVLKEFPGLPGLPETVLVAGGGGLLPGIVPYLQSARWQTGPAAAENLRVEVLTPKNFKGFTDATGKLNSSADVPILSVALDARDLVWQGGPGGSFWGKFMKNF